MFCSTLLCRYVFLGIYSCEMVIKAVAKGLVLDRLTYLRSPWNWLDFVVILSGYATLAVEIGNLAGLRTFRVLRALKTVSIIPGKEHHPIIISYSLFSSFQDLKDFCCQNGVVTTTRHRRLVANHSGQSVGLWFLVLYVSIVSLSAHLYGIIIFIILVWYDDQHTDGRLFVCLSLMKMCTVCLSVLDNTHKSY